jgi:hypothetical protein
METSKVFISYAPEDVDFAREIAQKLHEKGVPTWFPEELYPGDTTVEFLDKGVPRLELMKREITASDYVLVLLSQKYVSSGDFSEVSNTVFSAEWESRGITTLPVLIADARPPAFLKPDQYFNIKLNSEKDIDDLVDKITMTRYLDFRKLNEKSFELLVVDLLTRQGFEDVTSLRGPEDTGADIIARYTHPDKQGSQVTETYFIECKLYHSNRASVGSIQQFSQYLSTHTKDGKGLLITNSQLTAAANRALADTKKNEQGEIEVVEGPELKRQLLQQQDLIKKYFLKR